MKILVTGGTGRVGSEVVKELQKRNADIRLLVRKNDAPMPAGVETALTKNGSTLRGFRTGFVRLGRGAKERLTVPAINVC